MARRARLARPHVLPAARVQQALLAQVVECVPRPALVEPGVGERRARREWRARACRGGAESRRSFRLACRTRARGEPSARGVPLTAAYPQPSPELSSLTRPSSARCHGVPQRAEALRTGPQNRQGRQRFHVCILKVVQSNSPETSVCLRLVLRELSAGRRSRSSRAPARRPAAAPSPG